MCTIDSYYNWKQIIESHVFTDKLDDRENLRGGTQILQRMVGCVRRQIIAIHASTHYCLYEIVCVGFVPYFGVLD